MYGIDNLVDVAVDAIQVGQDVEVQLKDGFQILSDVPVIVFKDFGKIQDIAAKASKLDEELGDLTPDEVEQFEIRVSEKTNLPSTGAFGKVRRSIRVIARAYRIALDIKDVYFEVRDIFHKEAA